MYSDSFKPSSNKKQTTKYYVCKISKLAQSSYIISRIQRVEGKQCVEEAAHGKSRP